MIPLVVRLQAALAAALDDRDVPGVTADVFLDGAPLWSGAAGVANLETGEPMRPGSVFPIYSLTKTFTSVCALRLAAAGHVRLDDSIDRWLPSLAFASRVTLRDLLRHTAGVVNYSALPAYHDAVRSRPERPFAFEEFVEITCNRRLDFEPGERFGYSNTGYTLAKRILEVATGLSFGALIAREIASPLGLAHTFALESLADMQNVVAGYSRFFVGAQAERRDVRDLYHPGWCGTGVLASTGAELCRFYEAVFDGRLLPPSARLEMLALVPVPGSHPPARTPSYGLGVMADPDSRHGPEYGHGGGGPGFDVRAAHWPLVRGHALTVVVLCNADGEAALPIAAALASEIDDALAEVAAR